MRALLVVNHNATTTSGRIRDVLVQALRSVTKLDVAYTQRRGHAASLAAQAAADGVDAVVALGGDGTVNEVVNGLLARRGDTAGGEAAAVPALAVVPGGSTNVFARAVGLPRDWVEATGVLLEALRLGRMRTIGLGRTRFPNGGEPRFFTFCAGLGLDAEVIRRVEQARVRGKSSSAARYLRAVATQFLADPACRDPKIILERPGEPVEGPLAMAIVQNTAPWTYLGNRAIDANPDASFDLGLDVLAMRVLRVPSAARTAAQMLRRGGGPALLRRRGANTTTRPHGRRVLHLHDVAELTLRASAPTAFQLDGEFLGERTIVGLTSVPGVLRVIC
jgi:diacylglycerol kinase family enzyme